MGSGPWHAGAWVLGLRFQASSGGLGGHKTRRGGVIKVDSNARHRVDPDLGLSMAWIGTGREAGGSWLR